jgi:hypothetical protein
MMNSILVEGKPGMEMMKSRRLMDHLAGDVGARRKSAVTAVHVHRRQAERITDFSLCYGPFASMPVGESDCPHAHQHITEDVGYSGCGGAAAHADHPLAEHRRVNEGAVIHSDNKIGFSHVGDVANAQKTNCLIMIPIDGDHRIRATISD